MAVGAPGGYQNSTFLLPTHLTPFTSALGVSAIELKIPQCRIWRGCRTESIPLQASLVPQKWRVLQFHHSPPQTQPGCLLATPYRQFCQTHQPVSQPDTVLLMQPLPFPGRIQLPHRQPVALFPSSAPISDTKVPPGCSGPPCPTRAMFQRRGSSATHQHSCPG